MSQAPGRFDGMEALAWITIGLLAATLLGALVYLGNRIDSLGGKLDSKIDSIGGNLDSPIDGLAGRVIPWAAGSTCASRA